MFVDHERYYGLSMDALVTVCSWTTNVIMVWAWMHWSPCARGPRTLLWFEHGCTGHRVLVDHERYHDLGMDALVTVCSWTTNVIVVWARMHWSPCARGPRTLLWVGHGCTGHLVFVDHERYYGLSMDALVTVCSWTTNVIMAWACMHWSPCVRGPRTLLWCGHGCTGHRVLVDHERYYGVGMDALVTVCSWTTNVIMGWAWSTGHRVLVDHERYYGVGKDALVTVCSWTTNVIMVWAWMHWSPCVRGPRTLLGFEHGCTGHRLQKYWPVWGFK